MPRAPSSSGAWVQVSIEAPVAASKRATASPPKSATRSCSPPSPVVEVEPALVVVPLIVDEAEVSVAEVSVSAVAVAVPDDSPALLLVEPVEPIEPVELGAGELSLALVSTLT